MYGKFCADYRGYGNVNAALGEMVNSIGENAHPFRVSDDEKKLRKIVQDWWGEEVNSGPKRKRKLMENQEISVQYTSMAIVLPEQNDDDDAANNDADESEVVERGNVQY